MRRVSWGFADQALSSLITACWMFSIAHAASVHDFGVFALFAVAFTMVVAACRGLFGTPVALLTNRTGLAREASFATTTVAGLGLILATVLVVLARAGGAGAWMLPLAIAVPVALVEDLGRFHAIAAGRPELACLADGLWASCAIASMTLSWSGVITDITLLLGIWLLGAALAAGTILVKCRTRPRLTGWHAWWGHRRGWRVSLGMESLLGTGSTAAIQYVAALLIGISASAALRGSGSVFGPVAIFLQSIPLVLVPEMRLRGLSASTDLWRFLARLALPISALSATLGVAAMAVPDALGRLVLGDSWHLTQPLLPATGVEFALITWLNAANGALRAQGRATDLLRNRMLYASASVTLGCGAALFFGTALAVAIGLAIAAAITAIRARQVLFRPPPPTPAPSL